MISHPHDSHHCYCSVIIVRSCFRGRLGGGLKVWVVSLIKKSWALGAVSLSASFPVWLVCSQTGPVWLCPRLSVYVWVKVWCSLHNNKGENEWVQSGVKLDEYCALHLKNKEHVAPKFWGFLLSLYSLFNLNGLLAASPLLFSGGFAFVYEAQDMSSGKDYALKVRFRCSLWEHFTLVCL